MATKSQSKVQTNNKVPDKNLLILERLKWIKNNKLHIGWSLPEVEFISSWLISFDQMTWWWIPRGRVVEIFWPSGWGKTSFAMKIASEFSNAWERVLFMDTEWTYPKYLENIFGIKNIDVYSPTTWEEAVDFMVEAASMWYWLIILDSVGATVPMAMQNQDVEASNIGNMWKLMTKFMRLIVDKLRDNNCTLLCINHEKSQIWSFTWATYTAGWVALPYAASLRIRIAGIGWDAGLKIDKDTGKIVYKLSKLKIIKTKLKKLHEAEVELYLDLKGRFSEEVDVVMMWIKLWIISAWGWGWFKYWDTSLWQWVLSIKNLLVDKKDIYEQIKEDIRFRCLIIDKSDDIVFRDDIEWYNKLVEEYNKKFGYELELIQK